MVISALGKLFQASQGSTNKTTHTHKYHDAPLTMYVSLISCIEANVMIDLVL